MGYLIIYYDIPPKVKVRIGYRRKNSNDKFVYLSRYLYPTESPYTISNMPEGSYEIELTLVKCECGGLCSDPYYAVGVVSSKTTTSTTSTTTTSHTTSSTTTTTTTLSPGPIQVYWNAFTTDPGEPQFATLTKVITITHNEDYTIPTTQTTGLLWYIIREPSQEPKKLNWYNTDSNNGPIPDQVWQTPKLIGEYRYYKSRGPVAFNQSDNTIFSK